MAPSRKARMEEIEEALVGLSASPLYEHRRSQGYHAVLGEGSLDAQIMLIGEAPGEREAKSGRPFVGAWTDIANHSDSTAQADRSPPCDAPSPAAVLLAKERSRNLAALLAELPTAQADAFIACWNAKYTYWTERPVTAIRASLDRDWSPYVYTPSFPSYPSGHSTTSAAASRTPLAMSSMRRKA